MKIKYRIIMFTTIFLLCSVILYSALHAQVSTDNPGNWLSAEEPDKVENGACYTDEDTYCFIKDIIDNIDFAADFQPGNTQNEKLLKAQFQKFP